MSIQCIRKTNANNSYFMGDNSANSNIKTEQHIPCSQHETQFLKKFVTIWQPRKKKSVLLFFSYVTWHQQHWCYWSNVILCVKDMFSLFVTRFHTHTLLTSSSSLISIFGFPFFFSFRCSFLFAKNKFFH